MSAVATAVEAPVQELELVRAPAPTEAERAASEMNRWMLWFGLPMIGAAFFVGCVFATGRDWLIAPAAGLVVADILVLVWLAMSSDTNALPGEPGTH
jgi:hypothetical protein